MKHYRVRTGRRETYLHVMQPLFTLGLKALGFLSCLFWSWLFIVILLKLVDETVHYLPSQLRAELQPGDDGVGSFYVVPLRIPAMLAHAANLVMIGWLFSPIVCRLRQPVRSENRRTAQPIIYGSLHVLRVFRRPVYFITSAEGYSKLYIPQ